MDAREFTGKVAFVTGAGAGIGRAIAVEWCRAGGTAIVTDRAEELARGTAAEIESLGGRALVRALDVTDAAQIGVVIAETVAQAGGLDALFNVAGTNLPKDVEETDDDEWYSIVDVNLTSVYRCSKQAIPALRQRGGGSIVNIASIAGIMGEGRCAAYSASKGGVVNLTRNMAMDFARHGIRVNAICPAGAQTPRTEAYLRRFPDAEKAMLALRPMNRWADAVEIARPSIFLASSAASYITGVALVVDGGLTAGFRLPVFDKIASTATQETQA